MTILQRFLFNRKLRSQLMIAFILTLLLSVTTIATVSTYITTINLEEQVNQDLDAYGSTINDVISSLFDDEIHQMENIAHSPLIREVATYASTLDPVDDLWPRYEGADWGDDTDLLSIGISSKKELAINITNDVNPDITNYLVDIIDKVSYSEIFFTEARGYVISSSANTGDFAQGDESWWKGAVANSVNVEDYEFDESTQVYIIPFSFIIPSTNTTLTNGPIAGVLKASYNFKSMEDYLDSMKIGADGFAMLTSSEGQIVYHVDKTLLSKDIRDYVGNASYVEMQTSEHIGIQVMFNSVEYLVDTISFDFSKSENSEYIDLDWNIMVLLPQAEIDKIVQGPITFSIISAVIVFIILIAFSFVLSNAITGRIKVIQNSMKRGADGDLTLNEEESQKIAEILSGKDEVSDLAVAYGYLLDNVKLVVQSTQGSISILNATSEDMLSGMEEINSSAEEVASTSQAMSDGATTQTELITEVNENVIDVQKIVEDIVAKIQLNTQEVSQIALQTNILALNAGIEASRAGDYGRGFAVVAENVRKLSDQSKLASERIEAVAGEIRETLQASFTKISSVMVNVVSVSEETAASAEEVAAAAEEMTATIEELTSASQELVSQAESSQKMINKFKINSNEK